MDLIQIIVKGFSQIFFQTNTLFGLIVMVGLGFAAPMGLIFALMGNISGFLAAQIIGAEMSLIEKGLFGYNGVFVGLMVYTFVKNMPLALILVIVGSIIAAIISYYLLRNHISPFAAPFVLVCWGILILLKVFKF